VDAPVTDQSQRKIHIKWKRSGIGFTRRQRASVRGLGLRRLHHVVEREDTPNVRGLVSAVPHLVEIVKGARKPTPWAAIPEYTVYPKVEIPKEEAPARRARQSEEAPAAETHEAAATAKDSRAKRSKAAAAAKPAKKAAPAKTKAAEKKEPAKKKAKAAEKPAKAKTSKGKK
jgi:large subunit ribosomal protein L30